AGAWRELLFESPESWPPVIAALERRKFLVRRGSRVHVAKFSGFNESPSLCRRARALSLVGVTPRFLGFREGFLIHEWHGEARPLELPSGSDIRRKLLRAVDRYVTATAEYGRVAPSAAGAGPRRLLEMAARYVPRMLPEKRGLAALGE